MTKKLLVVDDSRFILEEIKHDLKDSEYEIIGYAKDGEEALRLYEELSPDLVTLDIILPHIEGTEVAKIMLKRWPEAKILIVSSLAYDDTIDEAKQAGVEHVLFKPFTKEGLLEKLDLVSKLSAK